jgi:uncharacterized membrane protein
MKINFLVILLIASIALNVVFVVKNKSNADYKVQKAQKSTINHSNDELLIKDMPNLSIKQKEDLKKIIKEFKIKLSEYKNKILAKRIDIIDELANPDFNIDALKKDTEALNEIENGLNLYFVESLGKISMIMNSEQRIKLLLKFSKYWFFLKRKK